MEVFLKPNTVIEPLFDQWYAWPHLISPATSAMNVTGRHLKIMQSFLKAPELHATAVRNPKMKGGPFMDVKMEQVDEVRQLMEDTYQKREYQVAFSAAIKELDQLLKSHKRGYSMESLYELVPEILKGYVELVYDLNNHPAYRLFESLLYRSKLYDPQAQSIALWVTNNDERPFVLSTPRLKTDTDTLHFQIPFSHEVIDELGKMKRQAAAPEKVKTMLGVSQEDEALFTSFFTTDPPPVYKHYTGDKIRIRYFGHACILVETKEVNLLIDPLISYYGYDIERTRFSDADLPDVIDYVLITHNHQDHILFETLLPIRHKIRNLVVPATTAGALQDPNLKLMFNYLGFKNVIEIHDLESIQFEDITITGIPFIGEHSDLNIQAKMCHHVSAGEFSMLFVADACNVEPRLYQHIREYIGKVDVVFLGMECDGAPLSWLYGPLLTTSLDMTNDQSRRLAGSNFERGKALIEAFDPKEVYVYAMGMEPWLEFISSIKYTATSIPIIESDKLIAHCCSQGKVAERLFGEKELFYEKSSVVQ
ncbi:MBL fold metallo-hydrolase [Chitinophaga polysaccharea]|uniref:MBL fold metallo-hydrolase n=1 Tax=Chitinophaga polysaccharea TaxID=1293035 RepID=UPI0014556514|nr:MBL fold metallo-hydrolase [Chitinophaga polysaccharea]NLR57677.1 MBL fold metallo-hydrolase [Chitinophaga polysaccharea]